MFYIKIEQNDKQTINRHVCRSCLTFCRSINVHFTVILKKINKDIIFALVFNSHFRFKHFFLILIWEKKISKEA